MENLKDLWSNLNLIEAEDQEIEIIEEEVEDVRRKGALCLIGKVWSD